MTGNHVTVGKYPDGLAEVDLLQFFLPRYAPACILTVNQRPLSVRGDIIRLAGFIIFS